VGEALKAELAARGPSVKHVLVDAESVNLIDTTACDALLSIVKELQSRGITLAFARVRDEVRERASGISLNEVDFAEIYDCFTITYLLQLEDLGFCKKGEAAQMIAEGHTRLDGSLPINTHGGLLSYSYRLSIEHVIEAVRQLRGEAGAVQVPDAEAGFVTGVTSPDFSVLVLSR
jgi:acetyl-CoA acetyltransferase